MKKKKLRSENDKKQLWERYRVIAPGAILIQIPLNSQALISDLIDGNLGVWKTALVRQVFLQQAAETILGIPLSIALSKDSLIWNSTPNGIFLVKRAYKIAMGLREQNREGSRFDESDIKKFWCKWYLWNVCRNAYNNWSLTPMFGDNSEFLFLDSGVHGFVVVFDFY